MGFLGRILKLTLCLICVLGMMGTFAASPSLADKCGSGDRVDTPECVALILKDPKRYIEVKNACSESVTLKFDLKGAGDKRETFDKNMGYFETVSWKKGTLRNVKCCPRYNSCNFPGERAF